MKTHCKIGAAILLEEPKGMEAFYSIEKSGHLPPEMDDPLKRYAATIAMTHHERWDGPDIPGDSNTQTSRSREELRPLPMCMMPCAQNGLTKRLIRQRTPGWKFKDNPVPILIRTWWMPQKHFKKNWNPFEPDTMTGELNALSCERLAKCKFPYHKFIF